MIISPEIDYREETYYHRLFHIPEISGVAPPFLGDCISDPFVNWCDDTIKIAMLT